MSKTATLILMGIGTIAIFVSYYFRNKAEKMAAKPTFEIKHYKKN